MSSDPVIEQLTPEILDHPPRRYSWPVWLATGGGLGLVVPAPGTVGAVVWGMPLAWAVGLLPARSWQLAALLVANLIGVPLCTRASRDLGKRKDPQAIIWDEIVTVPFVFLFVPLTNWQVGLAGLLTLRVLDIAKPPPARQLECLAEGLGVMADDWMAAVYAAGTMLALRTLQIM